MELHKESVDLCRVQTTTAGNQEYMDRVREAAEDVARTERRKAQCCRTCFYLRQRIGGATCSHRPCGGEGCGETLHSGNTCVDVLCHACGVRYGLCVRCGGDAEDKHRNKLERKAK